MKVIQVNCHYNYGSTGKIMLDIHNYLTSKGITSIQCYSRGKRVKVDGVYKLAFEYISKIGKLINMIKGTPLEWGSYSTRQFIKILEAQKPDIVHVHCINAFTMNVYKLLEYLRDNHYRTVLTIHAEFMYTGGCGHAFECQQFLLPNGCQKCPPNRSDFPAAKKCHYNWECMYNAVQGFNTKLLTVASVSNWLQNRAAQSTIFKTYKNVTVLNGIDISVFRIYTDDEIGRVREKYGISDENVILHVTSDYDAPIKGGKYVDMLGGIIEKNHDNYKIIVVGPSKVLGDHGVINHLGIIRNQKDLAVLYSLASIVVLTSEKETFSMICAESLSAGTPIAGFKAGAPETIALPQYSSFCEYGDIDALYSNMKSLLDAGYDRKDIESLAHKVYSSEKMSSEYLSIYKKMLNNA